MTTTLRLWRHPRPDGAAGRCIGRTDLRIDRRRAKRLAHRIRADVRAHGLAREVWTSPLQRCRAVGRWLRRFGFVHRVDADLAELDFGRWDGCAWRDIDPREVAAWTDDFMQHAPGGGEALASLLRRVRRFVARVDGRGATVLVVGHAGWINACRWWRTHGDTPPLAGEWPPPPGYGRVTVVGAAGIGSAD